LTLRRSRKAESSDRKPLSQIHTLAAQKTGRLVATTNNSWTSCSGASAQMQTSLFLLFAYQVEEMVVEATAAKAGLQHRNNF
jgi:hypothetical protein